MNEVTFEAYWQGGPGGPGRAIGLANAAAEAIHTLNYATMENAGGLVYPSNVGSIVSGLCSAVGNMRQLLDQLGDFTYELGHDRRLYHDQPGKSATDAAATARAQLQAAAAMTEVLRSALDRVYASINHLGVRDDEPADGPVPVDDRPEHLLPFSASGVPH